MQLKTRFIVIRNCRSVAPGLEIRMYDLGATVPYELKSWTVRRTELPRKCLGLVF